MNNTSPYKLVSRVTWITLTIYVLADLFGEFLTSTGWGFNTTCIRFIGCTEGFFGFDAIEHFLSGFVILLCLLLFFRKYPKWSPLTGVWWKDALILVMAVNLISFAWELVECAHDVFRLVVLHERLYSVRLNIDLLDQPSNLDTMGDMTFNVLGSVVSSFFAWWAIKKRTPKIPQA